MASHGTPPAEGGGRVCSSALGGERPDFIRGFGVWNQDRSQRVRCLRLSAPGAWKNHVVNRFGIFGPEIMQKWQHGENSTGAQWRLTGRHWSCY